MIYDFIIEVGHSIWKNGLSLSALGTALFVLLRQKKVKKKIAKAFPWLLSDDSEVKEYVSNQKRIESKLDALLRAGGIQWNAEEHALTGNTEKNLSISSQGATSLVDSAKEYTRRMKTLLNWRMERMKEYLKKLGRTKFQALLVSLVVNIASAVLFLTGTIDIDSVINTWMPVINMTIGTISTWVYIAVEGSIDKANAGGTNYDYTGIETERKAAEDAKSA